MTENLKYRRQYIITENMIPVNLPDFWKHTKFLKFNIYTHPDLEITIVNSKDSSATIVLLGFIIDPHNPAYTNTDIVHTLLETDLTMKSISDFLYYVAGRFVLLISTKDDVLVFNDPCGLRSVFYTKYNGGLIIASNPGIFKEYITNNERYLLYQNSKYFKTHDEHWLPSGCSLFDNVFDLKPNHMLQVSSLNQIRYYPVKPLVPINADNLNKEISDVVQKSSDILSKSLIAASNRYKLALSLTAGYDSRVLLAAAKGISKDVFFYTLKYHDMKETYRDISIPRKLMKKLNLLYNIIDCKKEAPDDFKSIYEKNTIPVHVDGSGKIAYGIFDGYPQECVAIKGSCSEIARCVYYRTGRHEAITSSQQIFELESGWKDPDLKFVEECISHWYDDVKNITTEFNIDILSLFYWEHRLGSWQSLSQLEWDIAQEAFTPYNNRELIETMLSVPTSYRCDPKYKLYRKIILNLWPECLAVKFNPQPFGFLRSILVITPTVWKIAQKIYYGVFHK